MNIEQIIAILLDEGSLGGFHLNNRKYADDDLMAGSINPYELFLIFKEIVDAAHDGVAAGIVYMLDQSHNIEPSLEGIIQSVLNTQSAFAKALLVDRDALRRAQADFDVVLANRTVMAAFGETCAAPGPGAGGDGPRADPLLAFRAGGYLERRRQSAQAPASAPWADELAGSDDRKESLCSASA